ncbi:MAG: WYL domain-containing protein [Lacipirellulaceae bacterium]
MNSKRITRLLKLLETLQAGNHENAAGLAKACSVSRRTIFRDLETLREAGVPLKFDRQRDAYWIDDDFFLPPTNFTAEEALSLIALADNLGNGKGQLPFGEPARRAAMKLESMLPEPLREEVRTVAGSLDIRLGAVSQIAGHRQTFRDLQTALKTGKVVAIEYESLTEWEQIKTRLRPYQLLFSQHSWYVIGRSSLHREVRTFRVNRISLLTPSNTDYSIPKAFSLEKYLGNAWRIMPESGRDQQVHIRFDPLVARNVAEVRWHKTQRTKQLPNGSLDFRVQVSGLHEIAWWILGYGDQAEVLKPTKLRKLVAGRINRMHERYNGAEAT